MVECGGVFQGRAKKLTCKTLNLGVAVHSMTGRLIVSRPGYCIPARIQSLPGYLDRSGIWWIDLYPGETCPGSSRTQGPGSRTQGPGSRTLDPGSWILDPGSWIQDPGSCWIPDKFLRDTNQSTKFQIYPGIRANFVSWPGYSILAGILSAGQSWNVLRPRDSESYRSASWHDPGIPPHILPLKKLNLRNRHFRRAHFVSRF